MTTTRLNGILLHPTSLPGKFGIGDFGPAAYEFIDFLVEARQKLWQILPLNYPGFGNSPYSALSAFAGNPYLISPEKLVEYELLDDGDLICDETFDDDKVLFNDVVLFKDRLLRSAFSNFKAAKFKDFKTFCRDNDFWLEDFAVYISLKKHFEDKPWNEWKETFRQYDSQHINDYYKDINQEVTYQKFVQYVFHRQWAELYAYAKKNGIRVIGDMPIYVAFDSADVWSHRNLFQLDRDGNPSHVAGVPPDYFSRTGQLWGNPLYNWARVKESEYKWWVNRIAHLAKMTDFQRIDHFIGFVRYWAIPAREDTAVNGHWEAGPAYDLFNTVLEELPHARIVAEDLGLLTQEVIDLKNHFGFPGMKVLQFLFSDQKSPTDFENNCIVYTGTHDNDTTLGWYKHLRRHEPYFFGLVSKFLVTNESKVHWDLIEMAYASPADKIVIPMQDILGLDSDARMNIPGTVAENWEWRLRRESLTTSLVTRLVELEETYISKH